MTGFADKVVGLYHFISDRAPKNIPLVDPKPRAANPWRTNGKALVARVTADGDIRVSIDKAIALLGNLGQAINRGDTVLVKPNFNSPDTFPGSTDPAFLRAVLELLLEAGARVTVGDSSGGIWRPSRNVFRKLGIFELTRHLGVELIAFEDEADDWVRIKIDGDYLKAVSMPRSAYEADKIIYLPCLKTHSIARYSGALKLAVGFMHPGERRALHARYLEQKAAEISLCWQPKPHIDGWQESFSFSGGPDKGRLEEPGLVLASGDLIAIDVEAIKVLLTYQAKNKLVADPWQSSQISTALKHGLGAGESGYVVVG